MNSIEYKLLSVAISKGTTVKLGGVEVWTRPDVDAVLTAMTADGWRLDKFAQNGTFAWLVFSRPLGG